MVLFSLLAISMSMFKAALVLAVTLAVTVFVARARVWLLTRQIIASAVLGGWPAVLMFDSAKRQNPISGVFVWLGAFAVGTAAGAIGAISGAGLTERARRPTMARLGAALGSPVGTYIAFAVVYSPDRDLFTEKSAMIVAAALVGALASAGYHILGGQPSAGGPAGAGP